MYSDDPKQPVLTSHEVTLKRVGPARGPRQHFDVQRPAPQNLNRPGPGMRHREDHRPRPQKGRPMKEQHFCHDQLLRTYRGAQITLTLEGGAELDAKLIDVDRYTLMVETDLGRELIYKSALVGIHFKTKAPEQG